MVDADTHDSRGAILVRQLGALERLFYRYSERNPSHFLIVAQFDELLAADQLRPALEAARRRHPLLSVHVEDRPATRLGFYRASTVAPVQLTIHRDPELSWQAVAAAELTQPFDRTRAPLIRATLLQQAVTSTLMLTFDHTIADGISSVSVLHDVVEALNGNELAVLPTPPSADSMIARALAHIDPLDRAELNGDPRMLAPSVIRRFDGTLPRVSTVTMTEVDTERLVKRCASENTTVHAAIVAAMCRVWAKEEGKDFVRVLNPINFRMLIGADRECALYMLTAPTGLDLRDGAQFWEQARATTAQIQIARSGRGIRTASIAIGEAMGLDADFGDAEELFVHACPAEMTVTNLGAQNLDGAGPIRPATVWGPVVLSQTDGEYVTGVTTYEGRLRMVTCGYNVSSTFLDSVEATISAVIDQTRRTGHQWSASEPVTDDGRGQRL